MKNASHTEFHIQVVLDGNHAVQLLSDETGMSRSQVKSIMQKGAVWLTRGKYTQRLRRATKALKAGDELHLYYDRDVLDQTPEPAELIADEGGYSVWFKPYGMLSQGSRWGDHCTLTRWAELKLTPQRSALLVHRLDRAATGLMLVAHSKKTANELAGLFRERKIEKRYRVLVQGEFPANPVPVLLQTDLDGRAALSSVTRRKFDAEENYSLLDVSIETGRKHQVRRHLSEAGFAVVGDRLYGDAKESGENLQLCAVFLSFLCPLSGQRLRFTAPARLIPKLLRLEGADCWRH